MKNGIDIKHVLGLLSGKKAGDIRVLAPGQNGGFKVPYVVGEGNTGIRPPAPGEKPSGYLLGGVLIESGAFHFVVHDINGNNLNTCHPGSSCLIRVEQGDYGTEVVAKGGYGEWDTEFLLSPLSRRKLPFA